MTDWDVSRSARLMIAKHGSQATEHAERLAESFLIFGDTNAFSVWSEIVRKIAEMQATAAAGHEPCVGSETPEDGTAVGEPVS